MENNALLKKIEERMDMLQAQMEDNVHLENENTVIATIDSLTKFWSVLSEEDKDYTIYCRKHSSTQNPEEILLDVNKLAKGKKFTSIGAFAISPDHKLMAYSVDFTGGEKYIIADKESCVEDRGTRIVREEGEEESSHGEDKVFVEE